MTGEAQAALLPDRRRLHLHHGPIDIIAEAFGEAHEVRLAYEQAATRFMTVLQPLVDELGLLRTAIAAPRPRARGSIARRMIDAVWPHRGVFITPMAAVAGAVADEVLAAMVLGRRLARAYVNNGGDIALYLAAGERLSAGVVSDPDCLGLDARVTIDASMTVRGLATSGWRGRSFSFGIADAVTVLAASAAAADAAATLIANAVNVDHPVIARRPANHVRDDTDLGPRLVTTAVGALPPALIAAALDEGALVAAEMRARGLIHSAYLALQGETRVVEERAVEARAPLLLSRHSPATQRVDRRIHRAARTERWILGSAWTPPENDELGVGETCSLPDGSSGPHTGAAGSRPEDHEQAFASTQSSAIGHLMPTSSEDRPA